MIKPLRKYHFVLWRCLAFALPLLFVLAIVFRPNPIERQYAAEDFSWKINSDSDSIWVVSVAVNNPLQFPSCLVYAEGGTQKLLLGQLDGVGDYTFHAPAQIVRIRLFDAIHQKDITEFIINKQ
jgi:hypothetical protein